MKTIGDIVTVLAAIAFMLSFCMMEKTPELAFATLFVSGIVLAIVIFNAEEERARGGRR